MTSRDSVRLPKPLASDFIEELYFIPAPRVCRLVRNSMQSQLVPCGTSAANKNEQKSAISYFLDWIEVLREKGITPCYLFDKPRPQEIDYILPGVEPESCVCHYGAEGGTRTPMGLLPLRPERSASTSSTTSARSDNIKRTSMIVKDVFQTLTKGGRADRIHFRRFNNSRS
jgi:hypothetical protein